MVRLLQAIPQARHLEEELLNIIEAADTAGMIKKGADKSTLLN